MSQSLFCLYCKHPCYRCDALYGHSWCWGHASPLIGSVMAQWTALLSPGWAFLCGFCMLSTCLCGFSPVSPTTRNMCIYLKFSCQCPWPQQCPESQSPGAALWLHTAFKGWVETEDKLSPCCTWHNCLCQTFLLLDSWWQHWANKGSEEEEEDTDLNNPWSKD